MKKTLHTPGPWKASPYSSVVGSLVSFGDVGKGQSIAAVMPQKDSKEAQANARLIASAPDMLSALLEVKAYINDADLEDHTMPNMLLRQIEAAIENAEGRE